MNSVRTRIAPSPTGYPHIGTIYQALFDFAFARKNNGTFFVRIEDTDRERFVEDAEEKIYEALDYFGLIEDESPRKGGKFAPYRQSERLPIYKKYAEELIEKGGAYYCFCTKERLESLRATQQTNHLPTMYDKFCRNISKEEIEQKLKDNLPHVIRLKVPEKKDIVVRDELRGEIHFDSNLIEDTVLIKSDGYPTYHLASPVVDDHLMKTSHLVRGEEWLSSLPKHWIMLDYFGWDKPLFYHTPVLRNPDKSKLSKRQGHTSVSWYIEEGFLPEAILNYLALLSWSHPEGKEIFSLKEFIEVFDLKDIKPVGPIFDIEKLRWMNGEYIRSEKLKLSERLSKFYIGDNEVLDILKSPKAKNLIELAQSRMKTLKEFKELVIWEKVELNDLEKEIAEIFKEKLSQISDWNSENILSVVREVLKQEKVKGSLLYKITTGKEHGLPLPETLEIIGKDKTLEILNQ